MPKRAQLAQDKGGTKSRTLLQGWGRSKGRRGIMASRGPEQGPGRHMAFGWNCGVGLQGGPLGWPARWPCGVASKVGLWRSLQGGSMGGACRGHMQ